MKQGKHHGRRPPSLGCPWKRSGLGRGWIARHPASFELGDIIQQGREGFFPGEFRPLPSTLCGFPDLHAPHARTTAYQDARHDEVYRKRGGGYFKHIGVWR